MAGVRVPCVIAFAQPFSLDLLPALPADGRVVATGLTVRYGSYEVALGGAGPALPTSQAARALIGDALAGLLHAVDHDADEVRRADAQARLVELAQNPIDVRAIQVIAAPDDADAYARRIGRPYHVHTAYTPPGDSKPIPDTQEARHNWGQETDWHPFDGNITWFHGGSYPGVYLSFRFDGRGLAHYMNEDAAFELQLNIPKDCYEKTPWQTIMIDPLLPSGYQDWNCRVSLDDGSNYGFGTAAARNLEPWRTYIAWIPLPPKAGRDPSCDTAEVKIFSQPSKRGPNLDPITHSLACEVYARDYLIPDSDPGDDENAMLALTPADAPDGVRVPWARNMCDIGPGPLNDLSYTGRLAPCIFLSRSSTASCVIPWGAERQSCPREQSLCTPDNQCEVADVQYDIGSIHQLGHGFTRGGLAACVVKRRSDPSTILATFNLQVLGDSQFDYSYVPEGPADTYTIQCVDLTTGIWSNRVDYDVVGLDGQCTCDHDGDGHASVGCLDVACFIPRDDCNDADANVHPGHSDICGNTIDDDCDATTSDLCTPAPSCPAGNGFYCGDATSGQNAAWLYQCSGGAYSFVSNCQGLGCVVHPPGENDQCQQPPQNTCGDHLCQTPGESCSTCPDCCLGAPSLVTPDTGATFADTAPLQFAWGALTNAASYELLICRDPELTTDCRRFVTPGLQISWSSPPAPAGFYYWSVRARPADTAAGWGLRADPRIFLLTHPGGCTSTCAQGDHRCANSVEESCIQTMEGCWVFGAAVQCPFGNTCLNASVCDLDQPPPPCTSECVQGAHRCANSTEESCVQNVQGCWVFGAAAQCPFGNTCLNVSVCDLDQPPPPCTSECVQGDHRCANSSEESCVQTVEGCWVFEAAVQCPFGNTCLNESVCNLDPPPPPATCNDGIQQGTEECDQQDVPGTCATEGYDQGAIRCTADCTFDTSQCCRHEPSCDVEGATRCVDGATQTCTSAGVVGGCRRWTAPVACQSGACIGNVCAPQMGCAPFTLSLPQGTIATSVMFWPGVGDAISVVPVTNAGIFAASPPGACAATLEYPGRWASWLSGTFPAGAPQGSATLTYPGQGVVGLCHLVGGVAAWGVAHDGICLE